MTFLWLIIIMISHKRLREYCTFVGIALFEAPARVTTRLYWVDCVSVRGVSNDVRQRRVDTPRRQKTCYGTRDVGHGMWDTGYGTQDIEQEI